MIDPLPRDATASDQLAALNKVIEAVNDHDNTLMYIDGKPRYHASEPFNAVPEIVSSKQHPGFRPLHIEDGQVKESVPGAHTERGDIGPDHPDYNSSNYRGVLSSAVPEAEPQEQGKRFISDDEEFLRDLAVLNDRAQVFGVSTVGHRLRDIAGRIAAHREYAQPEKGV